MDWGLAALSSAAIFAGVSVLDKRILTFYVPGVWGFYAIVGFIQLAMALVAALAVPWKGGPPAAALAAVASGALWGCVLLSLFYALRALEVSRAIPFYNTFPVFVAFMSLAFLGEELTGLHWLAIITVIVGAGLSTVGQGGNAQRTGGLKRGYVALVLASLFTAAGTVTSKAALDEMNFWNVFALRSLFLGLVLLVPGLMATGRHQALQVLAERKALPLIVFTEGMLAPAGLFTMLLALSLGPASLAATLMSTRPIFVLLISAVLSTSFFRLLDEPLTRDVLPVKVISTVLVVVGVGALSLA